MKKIISILFLALALRLFAGTQSLWLDEAINVRASGSRTVIDLVTNYSLGDFHPPIYHVILHYWIAIFGDSELSARMPSIFFGLVTIFFVYKISDLIFGSKYLNLKPHAIKFSLVPPILLSTSSLHVYYSAEARMYSLAAMAVTASIYFLLQLTDYKTNAFTKLNNIFHNLKTRNLFIIPTKKQLSDNQYLYLSLLFVLFFSLGLYTDYLVWFLLPLLFILLPVHTSISFLTTIPWWPYFVRQLNIGLTTANEFPLWGQTVGGFSFKSIALIPIKFLIGRVSVDNNYLYLLLIVPPLLITAYLFYVSFINIIKHKNTPIIFSWFFTPLVIGILISFKISVLSYFRFLFILPAFYFLLAHGLSLVGGKYKTKIFAALVLINIISTSSYLFMPKFHKENWRGLVKFINETPADNPYTLIPSFAQADPYLYYEKSIPISDQINFDLTTPPDTIYLLRYVQEIFDPEDNLRVQLEDIGYQKTTEKTFNGVVVWVYTYTGNSFALKI